MHRQNGLALFVVIALMVTACSGGDDESGPEPTPSETTSSTAAEPAPATTQTSIGPPAPVASGPDSVWCDRIRDAQEAGTDGLVSLDFQAFTSPESTEQALTALLDAYDEYASVAPPELASDVGLVRAAYQDFYERVAAVQFDLFQVSPGDVDSLDDQSLEVAAANIDAYSEEVCGVVFEEPEPLPTLPGPEIPPGFDDPVSIVLAALGLPVGLVPPEVVACVEDGLDPEFVAAIGPGYEPSQEDIDLLLELAGECGFSGLN